MSFRHINAQIPGIVVSHGVSVGDDVAEGDTVLVVETMKCEWPVFATQPGKVAWLAPLGAVVALGDEVARMRDTAAVRPPDPDLIADLLVGLVADGRLGAQVAGSSFTELDLDVDPLRADRLVEVTRRRSNRHAGVVVGRIAHRLVPHRVPLERVWLCGDATASLGAVAEAECRRIVAAIDLAEEENLPLEWVAVSSGARISMSSGTENMDWCAVVVRRLIEFTQAGGQVVIVVAGVNVGAQSYWNAEATMLMHCAGMLVMVEGTSMVLTGHRALARAGGISQSNDHDLGGTEVMTANGQAHHHVADLVEALLLVLEHHALCANGPDHPLTRAQTTDDPRRDVCVDPLPGPPGTTSTIGDVLDVSSNPKRTMPFAIDAVMSALVDRDAPVLRRWQNMSGTSAAHVWDTRVDGWPVSLIGIESQPREVGGRWEAAGTLYPMAARKVARALNHASGRRPVVVLANLAGFDGSRESLLAGQLEHGAELARSVVNFRGPLVVVVIGRFHGGAYVVFSQRLNPEVRIVALEGSRVSVIGGTAAAEVVLRREVDAHLERDGDAGSASRVSVERIDTERREAAVKAVAEQFDRAHDVERAARIGAVERVIRPQELRMTVAELVAGRLYSNAVNPNAATPRVVSASAVSSSLPEPPHGDRSAVPV